MSSRFPPACASAPAPATMVWEAGGVAAWELNPAARDWPATLHWSRGEWASLAQAVLERARQGEHEGHCPLLRLRWSASPLDGAWIAWLKPLHESEPHELQALREQVQRLQEQLRVAEDAGRMGVWERDLRHGRVRWDEHLFRLLGLEPAGGVPTQAEAVARLHPDDRERMQADCCGSMLRAGRCDGRYRVLTPQGGVMLVHLVWEVMAGADGQPERLIGVVLDVTDRAESNERALQAARSMELIAEATGVGVWTVELDTRETVWNGQMYRIFGIPPEVPVEQARRMALHLTEPADRDGLNAAYDLLASGQPAPDELEFRIRRTDGELRWVVGRGRFAMNGGRRVLFGVFIDVTEQRVTQERLRRAEQRTMLAAKAVGLAIWERDLRSGDTFWDAQMYRLRGLSPEDPRSPRQLRHTSIHPNDLPEVERRTAQVIAHEADYTFEFRVVWPDGTVRWLATRGSVVRDADGVALRILGVNWDITEHKRGEDMRREKAAAEEANRAKSEFLSRMSHELRTPMNAVLGFAQLMLADRLQPLGGGQRERTERIRNAGEHLLALIDDVLDLTSVEVGTLAPALRPVALRPLVDETLQWLAPSAKQAGVTLASSLREGVVMADPRRLRQVLSNLLSNAVKYNRPGGTVEIRLIEPLRHEPHGDELLGLCVRDTGRGLTSAQLERLFEPFNRLGAERDGIEGTGIGLTIVRALVQSMGGRVEVQSSAGEGSEFRVWLPRGHGQPVAQPAAASSPPGAPSTGRSAEVELLYIEDNPVNVLLVQELVALRPQVRLHVAIDGRSGIARTRAIRPRAVLIDLQLPDIDGFEVLRELRADPSLAGLVCIALSANAMPEDVARARRLGFDDYWTKPIDFGQFLGGLDRLSGPD
jgi:PAS domain S-box-containing protein